MGEKGFVRSQQKNSSKTFEEILEILKIVFLKWNARNVGKREKKDRRILDGQRRERFTKMRNDKFWRNILET